MNSHIQMPKCVLKEFAGKNNALYYYDFSKEILARGYPRSINTKPDFYSDYVESFLNNMVENPFSKVIAEIKSNNDIVLSSEFIESVIQFVNALIVRGKAFENALNSGSVLYQFAAKNNSLNDFRVLFGMDSINRNGGIVNDFPITIGVNETNTPFVLPNCGIYAFHYKNETLYNLPVTPNRSIVFITEKESQFLLKNKRIPFAFGENAVMTLNENAFHEECQYNKMFVVSRDKEELNRIVNKKGEFNESNERQRNNEE